MNETTLFSLLSVPIDNQMCTNPHRYTSQIESHRQFSQPLNTFKVDVQHEIQIHNGISAYCISINIICMQ